MIGVGAGLANGGKIPFICGRLAVPHGSRLWSRSRSMPPIAGSNIKLVGVSSGVAYGELGPTHHSIEDIAWTRAIDGLTVIVPADPIETSQAIRVAYETEGPFFIRTSRIGVPIVHAQRLPVPHRRGRAHARRRRRDHHRQRRHGHAGAGRRRRCSRRKASRRAY